MATESVARELRIKSGQAVTQLVGLMQQGKTLCAEDVGQVAAAFAVDGDTKGAYVQIAGFLDALAGVIDTVAAFIQVEVVWFAVGENEQQLLLIGKGIRDGEDA